MPVPKDEENIDPESIVDESVLKNISYYKIFIRVILICFIGYSIYFIYKNKESLKGWGTELLHVNQYWLLLALISGMIAVSLNGLIMYLLLKAARNPMKLKDSVLANFTGSAISNSLFGGSIISLSFIYHQMKKNKIPALIIAWELAVSVVLGTVAAACYGIILSTSFKADKNLLSNILSLIVVGVLIALAGLFLSHPTLLDTTGDKIFSLIENLIHKKLFKIRKKFNELVAEIKSVNVSLFAYTYSFALIVLNFVMYLIAFYFSARSINHNVSFSIIFLTVFLGRTAGTIFTTPGGVGATELAMFTALIQSGINSTDAINMIIVYRFTTWILVTLIGWLVYIRYHRNDPIIRRNKNDIRI